MDEQYESDQSNDIEEQYEERMSKHIHQNGDSKGVRYLLPIKTKDGKIKTQVMEEPDEEDEEENENEEMEIDDEEVEKKEEDEVDTKILDVENDPISMARLLATREEILQSRKFKIGILSSKILEDPELNVKKLELLIQFMNDKNPETYLTVRKLAIASLLEIFKDILPSYHIMDNNRQTDVRLKQTTLKLQNFEVALLKYFKSYLQSLEKTAKLLQKSYSKEDLPKRERESKLAILAISSMCELLVSRPYFNFSTNIANFLIPLLDCKQKEAREIVAKCFHQIFKEDMRGELSLQIVRSINNYIKKRKQSVHPEILQILLSLRIKNIDLEKEKEEEKKKKTLEARKKRLINLSKRERKRNKRLKQVEQEMLETQAEENKETKHKNLTEITNIVFTIYFRILKNVSTSKVLSACLEGLAKFTHCINVGFYQDLVSCINHLLENENLGLRDRLNCTSTVFTIFSGKAAMFNTDPQRFYAHLYKDLHKIISIKNHKEIPLIVKILSNALIGRQKSLQQNRLTAFVKRMSTVSLYLPHHGAIGLLAIIRKLMQLGSKARVLLDTENLGDGIYLPELEDPDYCNAQCTSIYEIVALQRHPHEIVRNLAKTIVSENENGGKCYLSPEIAKLTPEELCKKYDPSTKSEN